uniref:Zonadhesin-like n=1 Tax=Phallusia mammillata TaxID=59560 RepID=A0A6F9DWL8_9ASCI|nr:zonadhesin-like [Phallusia mammillata]
MKPCSLEKRCTKRCACKAGYVRDITAKCIPIEQCNLPDCPSNQKFSLHKPCRWKCGSSCKLARYPFAGCVCLLPTLWNGTSCVPGSQCQSNVYCPANQEHFQRMPCNWECNSPISSCFFPHPGCACLSPLLWNGTYCVPSSQCPLKDECFPLSKISCDPLPCSNVTCPSHPDLTCNNNFCGICSAYFTLNGQILYGDCGKYVCAFNV